MDRAVLTIASGKKLYLDMAFNLARSFLLWHQDSDIEFHLVTDHEAPTPPDLAFIHRVQKSSKQIARGFSSKLYLDQMAPAPKTLFIDADCLCFRNLDRVFQRFAGQAVSVVGAMKSEGEWFGDIRSRCQRYRVGAVPVFVGAVYYFEPGKTCTRVFETARKAEKEYDEAGFIRLRGVPNEEPLISVGMAQAGCKPIPDDGEVKVDAMYWKEVKINLLKGKSQVACPDGRRASPFLLHFNCSFAERPPYTNGVLALKLASLHQWPMLPAEIAGTLVCLIPYHLRQTVLNVFRPLYHKLFGFRKVRMSQRISF